MPDSTEARRPQPRPRRLWKALAILAIAAFAAVAALPWLLVLGPARARVLTGLNRAFAPGRLEFEELQLSWLGPTRLNRVTLLDPRGQTVARITAASLDRTLGQLLLSARGPAVLTLDGVLLEVERSAEGSINLAEALRTIIATPNPNRDLTIRIDNGSLRYRDPFLAEPLTADRLDLTIRVPFAPSPVTWLAKFSQGDASLEVHGDFDTWLSKGGPPRTPELQVVVVGKRWPFVARTAGLDAAGKFDGSLDFARKRGKWVLTGDARLLGLNARGKAFSGETLTLDRLEAGWDLAEGEDGWMIRRLSADSPLGQIKAEGRLNGFDGAGKQRVEAKVDLAEIARQLPHALHLRNALIVDRGTAKVSVDLVSSPGRTTYDIEANVSDLLARDHDRPISLKDPATFHARLVRVGDDATIERLAVKTSFLEVSARGRLEDGVDLAGSIELGRFREQLGQWVDLGTFDLDGRAELTGTYQVRPPGIPLIPDEVMETAREVPVTGPDLRDRPARYVHKLQATVRDLRVNGPGSRPIRRDLISINASAIGPIEPSGLPRDWASLFLRVQSEGSEARLRLESRGGPIGLTASARTPIRSVDKPRAAKLEVSGDWSNDRKSLTFDQIALALSTTPVGPPEARLSTFAKGTLDLSSGELLLEPIPGKSSWACTIDPEGLRVSGIGKGLEALRIDGGLSGDLERLDEIVSDLAGRSPLGLSGRWSAIGNARGDADGLQVAAKLGVVEPSGPASIALRAHYSPSSDQLALSEFTIASSYGTLDASGTLDRVTDDGRVDLKGKLNPDFGAINALIARKVEPGARVEGKPRSLRASGSIGEGWKGLDAEVGFDLSGADLYGMKFGPSPVVLRSKDGTLRFDPISTTLNEGHIRLEAEIDRDAPGGSVLRLAKNSSLREARINDEVSRRVLAYVAPVLDQATRASGLVSVDLDHAEFPIGPGRGRQAKVEGAVVFQNVEFGPGPLASEILGAIGRRDLSLKIDQPVTLTIADGRVNQRGMTIPLGDFTRIELAGWVDFDRNLSMVATVPVTPAMLGNNALLSDIAAGTKVRLPIGGTLDRPAIDKEAFTANLQDLGKSLLTRGATRGAMELLMRLARPKDPDAPRPVPDERKALRQQKKAIRRGEIPAAPDGDRRP